MEMVQHEKVQQLLLAFTEKERRVAVLPVEHA